ncbi:RNA polymerase sigma factor [Nonomuraea cavernae]|uniref:RNA polymerase sigma factor SigK n=1 Tax=Nonomuraea cavernae TaxID=2045107 RepID=A0A918DED6_9ACTN|nr:sigma-70 family RNA polymerase sigma factor [Nonomuraea cavernae]MCA2183701.1 sigma-70 family RNA polymerase sigma factor [Nonomuraea cavernae]GGO61105.1 RNA polymerase sigma factor SigK [Nonomuraea cavernae]
MGADQVSEIYRTHAPSVRTYLRRFVPSQDVDDMLQVVFTEAWRSRDRYDPGRSPRAWLLGIAHKRAVDHLRRRRPHTVPLDDAAEPAGDDGRTGATTLAERDRLHRALAELPVAQREAIVLAYYAGLSQREIAERLSIPLGTVKARTSRGLHRLATLLT